MTQHRRKYVARCHLVSGRGPEAGPGLCSGSLTREKVLRFFDQVRSRTESGVYYAEGNYRRLSETVEAIQLVLIRVHTSGTGLVHRAVDAVIGRVCAQMPAHCSRPVMDFREGLFRLEDSDVQGAGFPVYEFT